MKMWDMVKSWLFLDSAQLTTNNFSLDYTKKQFW